MAGRAGRRGLDAAGTVIILAKGVRPPDEASLREVLCGKPIRLESRYRITYGMLLNLLRVERLRIEEMLQHSFFESASLRQMEGRKENIKEVEYDFLPQPVTYSPPLTPHSRIVRVLLRFDRLLIAARQKNK